MFVVLPTVSKRDVSSLLAAITSVSISAAALAADLYPFDYCLGLQWFVTDGAVLPVMKGLWTIELL